MTAHLDSARYMVTRAEAHATEFKQEVRVFFATHPYDHLIEEDPNTGDQVGKSKLIKPIPPMLNGVASDAVCNLRSALDQVGYAAAIAVSGSAGRSTHFPFGDTPDEVCGCKGAGSKEVPAEIFAVMESFKPYKGGNDFLWALNKLANANKHRIISPATIATLGLTIKGGGAKDTEFFIPPVWDSAKNEAVFFRMRKGGYVNYNVEVADTIAFSEIDVLQGLPADHVLDQMLSIVSEIVSAVDAEAVRIGLFK